MSLWDAKNQIRKRQRARQSSSGVEQREEVAYEASGEACGRSIAAGGTISAPAPQAEVLGVFASDVDNKIGADGSTRLQPQNARHLHSDRGA